jgi:hypothetical protein
MLKRKITEQLIDWKINPDRNVLFLKGPRGVGKTTAVENFAKEHYDYFIHINFEKYPLYKSIFSGSLDMGTLTKQITLKMQTNKLVAGKTLIFLDEIHLCPRAREAAFTFINEQRFDVIEATSLFGTNPDKFDPTPLSYETLIEVMSLDFEEFLWASGVSELTINEVYNHFLNLKPIPASLHIEFMNLFREYMVVGGMPAVVDSFIHKHNFKALIKEQAKIIKDYEHDIDSSLKKVDRNKVRLTFNSLPSQLVKDNKKFQYGVVELKGNARKFESSVLWLYDADMIHISFQLEELMLPFANHARFDIFKVYYKDIGLLTGQLGQVAQQAIIDGDIHIYNNAVLESTIADLLYKQGYRLYYFTKNTTLHMEFMFKYKGEVTALSVNEADNTKAKALTSLIENHDLKHAIELTTQNMEISEQIHRYPIYCVMFL